MTTQVSNTQLSKQTSDSRSVHGMEWAPYVFIYSVRETLEC